MKRKIPRFIPQNPIKPPTPFVGGYVPFSPEKFNEIKEAANKQYESPKPRVLTYKEILEVRKGVEKAKSLYFFQTAAFNNYAAACAVDASAYLQRWPEWAKIKKHYDAGMGSFYEYEHRLRTTWTKDKFSLHTSFADLAYKKTALLRRDAILAMTNVAQRHGCRHALTVGHAAFAKLCIDYSLLSAKKFNEEVRGYCGIAFNSQKYKVVLLNGMEQAWNEILALLPDTNDIDNATFESDKECNAKMDAVFRKLSSIEFVTECAVEAAIENKEHYSEWELEEIIKDWNEYRREHGIKMDTGNRPATEEELERLKAKFK